MSIIPEFSKFKKELAQYDVGYDVYTDVVYVYEKLGFRFLIDHQEEKYGNDTHGWGATLYHPDGCVTPVAYKEISKETAYQKLQKYTDGKRLAAKSDRKILEQCRNKRAEIAKKRREFDQKHSIQNRKSEFIECKKCGSKLSKIYVQGNICPLCNTDLRSDTIVARLKKYDKEDKELAEMINKLCNGRVIF